MKQLEEHRLTAKAEMEATKTQLFLSKTKADRARIEAQEQSRALQQLVSEAKQGRADARQARDQALAIVAAKEKQPREELPLARRLSMIKVADLKTTELALVQLFAKDCSREQFRRKERESEMEEERKTLESEKEKVKEAKECTICLERDIDVVFNCGHQA